MKDRCSLQIMFDESIEEARAKGPGAVADFLEEVISSEIKYHQDCTQHVQQGAGQDTHPLVTVCTQFYEELFTNIMITLQGLRPKSEDAILPGSTGERD